MTVFYQEIPPGAGSMPFSVTIKKKPDCIFTPGKMKMSGCPSPMRLIALLPSDVDENIPVWDRSPDQRIFHIL
jgi:hypothetical protein